MEGSKMSGLPGLDIDYHGTAQLQDGLKNLVTGLGGAKDARASSYFEYDPLSKEQLDAMYASEWLTGKVTDIPPDDMTRNWRKIKCPSLTPEQIEEIEKAEKDLLVRQEMNQALKWARLYGGGCVIMGLDGTGEVDEPLNLDSVRRGSLRYLLTVDQHDLIPENINEDDPNAGNFRYPNYYKLSAQGKPIHHSRIIRFDGVILPWRVRRVNHYWHGSYIARMYSDILNAKGTSDNVASLVYSSTVDVIAIEGLMQELAGGHEDKLVERFQLAAMLKNNLGMLLIDGKEVYDRKTHSFGGNALPALLTKFFDVVSGASDIPVTRLMGSSPGGLNATGEGDESNYYDGVQAKQEQDLAPRLNKFDEVLVRHTLGQMPDDWGYEFVPLKQVDPVEQSTVNKTNAETAQIYSDMGAVPAGVVTEQLFTDKIYDGLTSDLVEAIKDLDDEDDATGTSNGSNE